MTPRYLFIPVYRLLSAEWREWMDRTADVVCPPDRVGAHLDAAIAEDDIALAPTERPSGPA